MSLPIFITGFFSIVIYEWKRMIHNSLFSYLLFLLLIFIAASCFFAEEYSDVNISQSILTFNYGDAPMADIMIFFFSFFLSSTSDVISGTTPNLVIPVSIGVTFFIIFIFTPGLVLISLYVIKMAAASIAGEKERKTLYILSVSPQTKTSIYFAKFIGIFFLTIPMILFLQIVTRWIFFVLFSTAPDISRLVLFNSIISTLFFSSLGMLVSVLGKRQGNAYRLGQKVVVLLAGLAVVWIFAPLIEFMLYLTNRNADFMITIRNFTMFSPFTLNLISVYNHASYAGYSFLQILVAFIFFILGMVIFIKQDVEY